MGYSCSAYADEIRYAIEKLPKFDTRNQDGLFLEIGRENQDGAITGSVYKKFIFKETCYCKKIGNFRISKNGIERFPGLTKEEKQSCEREGFEMNSLRIIQVDLYMAKRI